VPKVAIPDRHRPAFTGLLELSSEQLTKLCSELDSFDGKYQTLVALIGQYVDQPAEVLQALTSFRLAITEFKLSEHDVSDALATVTEEQDVTRILPLLNSPAIGQFAKAVDLRNAYERILTGTRVLSDIRPVFPDDDEVPTIVEAAMVNHTLKISFYPGDRGLPGEIHIALDATDLRRLRDQINRALDKERAARALIEQGGAVVLEPLAESE
jgi:hypothetical protein